MAMQLAMLYSPGALSQKKSTVEGGKQTFFPLLWWLKIRMCFQEFVFLHYDKCHHNPNQNLLAGCPAELHTQGIVVYVLGVGQESPEMDFNTLTHNQNQTAFSFIYFLLPCHLCDRRKDVPVSIKKQDACISR